MHVRRWLLVLLACSVPAAARAPVVGDATLRPTVGGVLLELVLTARDREGDTLRGVWVSRARAKLLRCQPRCQVVEFIPVQGQVVLGRNTQYRVVVGGRFKPGRKVGLMLGFDGGAASVEAVVSRDTSGLP